MLTLTGNQPTARIRSKKPLILTEEDERLISFLSERKNWRLPSIKTINAFLGDQHINTTRYRLKRLSKLKNNSLIPDYLQEKL